MDYKDIATPTRTKALLNQYGFNFKKLSLILII